MLMTEDKTITEHDVAVKMSGVFAEKGLVIRM
jgi:hypothetical protein